MSDTLHGTAPAAAPSRSWRALKWIVIVAALLLLFLALREAADPFGDKPYIPIQHGDHVHYVPRDADPNVSISRFPRQEPGPDERITPQGRIVPR